MKTIMLMATTVNGFIAREDGDSDFVTADAWKDYLRRLKKAGCCIMGYKTYAYLIKHQDFPLPCYNVILTKKRIVSKWKNVTFTGEEPRQILRVLEKKGFTAVLLCGGATANSSFLRENLVDEFYLYLVPVTFGKGILLLNEMDLETKLKLLSIDRFSGGVLGLGYKVVKTAKKVKVHS